MIGILSEIQPAGRRALHHPHTPRGPNFNLFIPPPSGPLRQFEDLEQYGQSGGYLPCEQRHAGYVRADVHGPSEVVPPLHVRYHPGREGPEHDESGPGVQVWSGEELPCSCVRVERSLRIYYSMRFRE